MTRQQKLTFGFIAGLLVLGYFAFRSPASQQDFSSQQEPTQAPLAKQTSENSKTENKKSDSRSMHRAAASEEASDDVNEAPTTMSERHSIQMAKHDLSPIKRDVSVGELRDSQIVQGSWKLVTSVFAIPRAQVSEDDRSMMVGELSGFALFESGRAGVQEDAFTTERALVVYDTRLQVFGVMTGTLMVFLRSGASMEALVQDHGLRVLNAFPETGTYYVTSREQPFNLSQLKNSLERDSRINNVEIEIVSRQYGKR